MTLIDTSAWIEFFRPKGDPLFKALVRDLIAIRKAAYTCPVHKSLHPDIQIPVRFLFGAAARA